MIKILNNFFLYIIYLFILNKQIINPMAKFPINNLIEYLAFITFINFFLFLYFQFKFDRFNYRTNIQFTSYSPSIQKLTINNGESLKIGIISDFQLARTSPRNINNKFYFFRKNLKQTLKVLKKNKVNLIIIAGDITHYGKESDYQCYKEILESVYKKKSKPKILAVMGNHDYLSNDDDAQKLFYKYTKENPYSHYIINNFHFILWSSDNYIEGENAIINTTWIEKELEIANKSLYKEGDPIFVISHIPPYATVYGSVGIWGNKKIYNILKNYTNVISISGHSHYSLINTRSIWQGEFTAINTQSISYVDLDRKYDNYGNIITSSFQNCSMGLIANLNRNNIVFKRVFFIYEEFLNKTWVVNFPIKKNEFLYTIDLMEKENKPPYFKEGEKLEIVKNMNIIKFNAAVHEKYVHHYLIVFINKINNGRYELKYYSDYYMHPKFWKKKITLNLPIDIKSGNYFIQVYAVDSFDLKSNPLVGELTL